MEQIRAFVEGCESVDYKPEDCACAHAFVRRTDCVRYEGDPVDGKPQGRGVMAWADGTRWTEAVVGRDLDALVRIARRPLPVDAPDEARARWAGRRCVLASMGRGPEG